MAEAEAVCDRVAIMVSGRLRWVPIRTHPWPPREPWAKTLHCTGLSLAGAGVTSYSRSARPWPPGAESRRQSLCLLLLFLDFILVLPPGVLVPYNTWKANLGKIICSSWRWRTPPRWNPSTVKFWDFSPRLLGRKGKDRCWLVSSFCFPIMAKRNKSFTWSFFCCCCC